MPAAGLRQLVVDAVGREYSVRDDAKAVYGVICRACGEVLHPPAFGVCWDCKTAGRLAPEPEPEPEPAPPEPEPEPEPVTYDGLLDRLDAVAERYGQAVHVDPELGHWLAGQAVLFCEEAAQLAPSPGDAANCRDAAGDWRRAAGG